MLSEDRVNLDRQPIEMDAVDNGEIRVTCLTASEQHGRMRSCCFLVMSNSMSQGMKSTSMPLTCFCHASPCNIL